MVEEARRRSGRAIAPLEAARPPGGGLAQRLPRRRRPRRCSPADHRGARHRPDARGRRRRPSQSCRAPACSWRPAEPSPADRAPGRRFSLVAMRQRLLSEAALQAARTGQQAAGGRLPDHLGTDHEPPARPAVLRRARRRLAEPDQRAPRSPARPAAEAVGGRLPRRQQRRELPAENFASARQLQDAGARLDALLPANDTVGRRGLGRGDGRRVVLPVRDFAHAPASVGPRPLGDRDRASSLHQVTIDAPPSVTLSSDTGNFSATVTNGLDEPVLVRVLAETDPQLQITPSEPSSSAPTSGPPCCCRPRAHLLGRPPGRPGRRRRRGRPRSASGPASRCARPRSATSSGWSSASGARAAVRGDRRPPVPPGPGAYLTPERRGAAGVTPRPSEQRDPRRRRR